ncbi:hypothetical protein QQ045_012390 [Rhodiola kirilowii]
MAAGGEALTDTALISKLEASEFANIYSLFDFYLRPFTDLTNPKPAKKPSRSRTAANAAAVNDVTTIRTLAKKFLPFLNKSLSLIPKRLLTDPKPEVDAIRELLEAYELCLRCLEAVISQLSCKPWFVYAQRTRMMHCFEACGRYREAEDEGFGLLGKIGGLDGVVEWKGRGLSRRCVPKLGTKDVHSELAMLVVDIVVTLVKCISMRESKEEESYKRVLQLVGESRLWFRVLDASAYEKLHRALITYLNKCIVYLVEGLSHFNEDLVYSFCSITLVEYGKSSMKEQTCKFARRIISSLLLQMEKGSSLIIDLLHCVLQPIAQDIMLRRENTAEEFLDIISCISTRCRNGCPYLHTSITACLDDIAYNFFQDCTWLASTLRIYSFGLRYNRDYLASMKDQPKLVTLLEADGNLKQLKSMLFSFRSLLHTAGQQNCSLSACVDHPYVSKSTYFDALNYMCHPFAEFVNSNKKHILAEEEGTILSTNLCVIHDAILMLCEAFLFCQSHKTKDERAEPDDNSKYVVNAAVAALILSIRTNRQIEKSVNIAEKIISDGLLRLQGLKFLFVSFYNIGVTLFRSKLLAAASEALKLCCRASWACVSLLCQMFIKNSHSYSNDMSEADVMNFINDACTKSAFYIDVAHQCLSHDVKKELIYCLENWAVVGTLIKCVSAPTPLVKQWVKIECKLYREMDPPEMAPTLSSLLQASSVHGKTVAILLEQELLEYEEISTRSPAFCNGMQMKIVDILLSDVYTTKAALQRSKYLMKKAKLLRICKTGTFMESIQCISEAIDAMQHPHNKACKWSIQDHHQLASAYCLRAFFIQEADPSSKKILQDVEAAMNIWLSLPECCGTDVSCLVVSETAIPLVCHVLDLLSLKVHTRFHGNLYKLLIKFFTWRNIPPETYLPFLWESRRLSHALCASPTNEDFIFHLSEHVGEQCKSMEYWISCLEGSQNLILGFDQKFSYQFVSSKSSYRHRYTVDEVKEAARNLTFNVNMTRSSIFLAGHLYHDLSERLVYSGKLIEGLMYAKEAHRLRSKLLQERFTYTIKQLSEPDRNVEVEKQDYSLKNFTMTNTMASELWSLKKGSFDLESYPLSPWNVLQCYIESTLQVGIIHEMLGNSVDAEILLKWGQNLCSSQGLDFLSVAFSCVLGKLYRKKKLWGLASDTLEKGKNVFSDCMLHITCLKCKSIYAVDLDLQLGDLFRSQFTFDVGYISPNQVSQAENLYKTGLYKLKLPEWRNSVSCPRKLSEGGTKTRNRKPKDLECNARSTFTSNVSCPSASPAACEKPPSNLEPKRPRKIKETQVNLHLQRSSAAHKNVRVTRSRTRSSQSSNSTEPEDVLNGYISCSNNNSGHASSDALSQELSDLDLNDSMLPPGCAMCLSRKLNCWQCLPDEVLKSGSIGSFVSLKWEFLRRRLSLKLLSSIGKCLLARGQTHAAHEVYCESVAVLMSENHIQYTFSASRLDAWFGLINKAAYGDAFAVERAAVLFNLCLHSVMSYHTKNARDLCCDVYRIEYSRIVSLLKLAFVLCREVPNLFQKVSRLLAALHVLSASTELFSLPKSSLKALSDSHWAAYFHQASIGTHLNYQLLSSWAGKSISEYPSDNKVAISTSDAADKWEMLRLAPESVQCLDEFVSNFYQGLPSATVLCFSLLGGTLTTVLRELLGYPSTVNALTLLSRFNSINQPIVTLQPVDSVLDDADSTNSVIRNLFGDDDKDWQCPWGSTIVDDVVPIFRGLLKENYVSSSNFPVEDTKNNRSMWWARRKTLDQSLDTLLRDLEDTWFGVWKYLFLAGWSDCSHLDSITKKLSRDLKRKCKLDLNASLLKIFLGGARYTLEKEESFLKLTLENGCYIGQARNFEKDMEEGSSSTSDNFESLSTTAFQLILDAANELEDESSVRREPIILVLDLDVQMLPLESMPILRNEEVYRMPSVGSIALTYDRSRIRQDQSTALTPFPLIDPLDAFYLLNPSGDLGSTQQEFEKWFRDQNLEGKAGDAPTVDELFSALKKHDLFIYFGHGSGAQYLPSHEIQKLENCAATLLMGCSSGSLHLNGSYLPRGMPLSYLMAGSPAIIANLWEVTDKDIDRFGKAILEAWLRERSVHDPTSEEIPKIGSFISKARDACTLPYLIGAAPVCYGVPTGIWRKNNT